MPVKLRVILCISQTAGSEGAIENICGTATFAARSDVQARSRSAGTEITTGYKSTASADAYIVIAYFHFVQMYEKDGPKL